MKLSELSPEKYEGLINGVADSIKDFYTVEYTPARPWDVVHFAEHLCRRVARELEAEKK